MRRVISTEYAPLIYVHTVLRTVVHIFAVVRTLNGCMALFAMNIHTHIHARASPLVGIVDQKTWNVFPSNRIHRGSSASLHMLAVEVSHPVVPYIAYAYVLCKVFPVPQHKHEGLHLPRGCCETDHSFHDNDPRF
eukprot:Blabericola_migrator_1__3258@NODE_195_length_11539_cov_221_635547_g168_i0_p8_GENE_NODE_195_length_11539_cov_221_635547_g168_i0NODE_195_length_11539_cov_221_635547_g168_i0_p8_ORF_typecomplete_len135_score2_46_NODE_195_length_11539_cov_221_635547_g168_i015801984